MTESGVRDIGEVRCETRHQGGEWIVLYNDPDDPNANKGFGKFVSVFGAGRNFKKPKDALVALAADLRRRKYMGSLKNEKPTMIKKRGLMA